MSHDLLDDLLADVPRHVTADPAAAWRTGTARRRRRYVAEGLAVVAALVLAGLGLVQLHDRTPVQPTGEVVVPGHPASVPKPWRIPDLPARPGPMAGAVDLSRGNASRWLFVAASGETYLFPSEVSTTWTQPVPSDDGRWLAFLRTDDTVSPDGTLVLQDLVTGEEQEFPEVGTNQDTSPDPWMTEGQTPGFWSPDDRRVVLFGFRADVDDQVSALLLTTSGEFRPLSVPGRPVGWLDDSRIAWLSYDGSGLVVSDDRGAILSTVSFPAALHGLSQWSGRSSPDGSQVAVLRGSRLTVYSVTTGAKIRGGRSERLADGFPSSSPVWHDGEVLVWDGDGLVDPFSGERLIAFSSRWGDLAFSHWAADAVDGPVQGGPSPLNWRYWPFLWWKQLIAVGVGLVLVVGLRRQVRSRRATPGAPSPPSAG